MGGNDTAKNKKANAVSIIMEQLTRHHIYQVGMQIKKKDLSLRAFMCLFGKRISTIIFHQQKRNEEIMDIFFLNKNNNASHILGERQDALRIFLSAMPWEHFYVLSVRYLHAWSRLFEKYSMNGMRFNYHQHREGRTTARRKKKNQILGNGNGNN